MKKIYLLMIMLFCLAFIGFAQSKSTLLNEGFEGITFPPDEWSSTLVSGYNSWGRYNAGTATAPVYCASVGYGAITQENWLITPQLMPSATNYQLTFWIESSGAYPTTSFYVKVSTTDNTVASFNATPLLTLVNITGTLEITNTWTQYSVDLTSYINQPIFIGFHIIGGGSRVCLNDITGIPYAEFANDLKINSLVLPASTDFKYTGENVSIPVIIKNTGTQDQIDAVINFKVDGVSFKSELLTIAAGVTDTVTVSWPATVGTHTISAEVPSDDNSFANSQSGNIIVYPVGCLVESFEGATFPPTNWTNEGSKWSSATYNYYNGVKCIASYTSGYKLITPKLIIANDDSLSFYANASTTTTFAVFSSTDLTAWDTLGTYTGTGSYNNYKIYFNSTTNPTSIGNRYVAFVITSTYGSINIDMVYATKIYPVTDDFRLVSFTRSTTVPKATSAVDYLVTVKNNASTSQSKMVYLKNDSTVLASATSKALAYDEQDTVIISWIPDQGYPSINLTAELPDDDVAGNNKASLATYVYPQDPIEASFTENFDASTIFPNYWITDSGNSTWITIAKGSAYSPTCNPHSGNEMVDFKCYSTTGNVKLTTPWLNFPYSTYKVSFWLYRDDYSYSISKADLVNVRVNSIPDTTGSVLVGTVNRSIALQPVVAAAGWYRYEFFANCSKFNSGFVILEGVALATYRNIYIDDFTVEGIPDYDASIVAVSPADTIWGHGSTKHDVSVILKNNGWNSISNATIHWSVDDIIQPDYAWTGSLDYLASDTFTIATDYAFTVGTTHKITASVEFTNDLIPSNNLKAVYVKAKASLLLPYSNDFENTTDPIKDWIANDADGDGFTWAVSTALPQSGVQHARSASYNEATSSALTPDNWLISPGLYIEHSKAYLSYYVGAGDDEYFAEHYAVLVSEKGTDTADFKVTINSETLVTKTYKKVTLELNGYQGKTILIAFRHYNCTDNLYLNIDNISLYYPPVYNVSVSASPVEGGAVVGDDFIEGESVTVYTTVNTGYQFVNWTENGTAVSTNAEYTFTPTAANHLLVANFDTITYTILASAGGNGTINPSGNVSITYFDSKTFEVEPSEGYQVADVLVDGTSIGAVSSYIFSNVLANRSISASFKEKSYIVTFTILHGSVPVADATISIEGIVGSIISNASGEATVELKNGMYNFTVEANGYNAYSGSLTVTNANVSVSANISATAVGDNTLDNLLVYPNPFNSFVRVENMHSVAVVIISDIIGTEIKRVYVNNADSFTVNLDLPAGVYLFAFVDGKGNRVTKKLIKR